ncbi:MAG: MobA/MobL family protein, partial [Acidobacteria bacterium]|nr:MobA/MobL family protein [Acidobacteriota bacterium]
MYCHVNVKTGSRGTGQSAAAKYDYISRAGKYGAASRDEVVHLESGSMPSFASSDARLYWAAADCHERSNGRLFRSLTAALPNSLDSAGRLDLARSFAAHVTAGELPYTLVVHAGLSKVEGKPDNPHLHLVFSERVNDGVERAAEQWFRRAAPKGGDPASGGARKSERTKPRAWLEETRQAWASEMNLAFDRAGVADRVTPESHAAQLARAREAGDAAADERLLLNPPSAHIGPAAKHGWEDRSSGAPALKPDRYVAYEEASASAREARSAHARAAAEATEARSRLEKLDAEIAALEAEQRRADDAAARRRKEADARREAERRRAEAKRDEERKARRTALGRRPGGVELYLAYLADIDPKWNVDGNDATTG